MHGHVLSGMVMLATTVRRRRILFQWIGVTRPAGQRASVSSCIIVALRDDE